MPGPRLERARDWLGRNVSSVVFGSMAWACVCALGAIATGADDAGRTLAWLFGGLTVACAAILVWHAAAALADWWDGPPGEAIVWREPEDDWRVGG